MRPFRQLASILAWCLVLSVGSTLAQGLPDGWVEVDYGALVDRRQLSHSGEPVGVLLNKLAGKSAPASGAGAAADRVTLSLLDPLLEPYAFVLSDTLDRLNPQRGAPMVEIGSLWEPGETQPAWVELLRARNLIVESDGAGRMRLCLPWNGRPANSAEGGAAAYRQSWPILRWIFDAELQRLGSAKLQIEVHPFLHAPAQTRFLLGLKPYRVTLDDTRADGLRPPLDLQTWQAFLDSGWQLEGGRLEPDGSVRLLGSRVDKRPTILGRPLSLADFAVAYRAVFHGGLAEPYMSLDRGRSPQLSTVNYGGRLRDTALGLVSLLCDIRFKTFSLGIDIVEGRDLRADLRGPLPQFRTHLERFATDPRSAGVNTQQTRLWFYPDRVDLTVSPQGDVLALRRVRMSAASERVQDESDVAPEEVPPWTRATVEAINKDYDGLVAFFPELADLDQVVRLLSLFTWLKQARADGLLTPDLDALLAIELPAVPTPQEFPQLLSFNALPQPDTPGEVQIFDRVPVADALERLNPADGRSLDPRRRYARAIAKLNRQDPQHAALLARYQGYDIAALDPIELDLLAHRAERLRMHEAVLTTLDAQRRDAVVNRQQAGEKLRIFSVGIGGLDLGMNQALERASGRSLLLASTATQTTQRESTPSRRSPNRNSVEPREAWRAPAAGASIVPAHGVTNRTGTRLRFEQGGDAANRWVFTLAGADSPEVRSRRRELDSAGRSILFERVESRRHLRYRFQGEAPRLKAVLETVLPQSSEETPPAPELPSGLVVLRIAPSATDEDRMSLRLDGQTSGVPRQMEDGESGMAGHLRLVGTRLLDG